MKPDKKDEAKVVKKAELGKGKKDAGLEKKEGLKGSNSSSNKALKKAEKKAAKKEEKQKQRKAKKAAEQQQQVWTLTHFFSVSFL